MNDSPPSSDAPTAEALRNDPHYLRALTDMADRKPVVCREAIYSDTGIKLLEQGTVLDSRMYDKLVQQRLRDPLEDQLAAEDQVDVDAITQACKALCQRSGLAALLAQHLGGDTTELLSPLARMEWPPQAAIKLSVMRDQQPALYQHSLSMMLTALFLAQQSGWSMGARAELAAGALLHDVGMLYMPPSWADPAHRLTAAERKHLAAHAITAMLVVREMKVFPERVATAVLEHHECLDGSGYPRGLAGSAISSMGQVLALAEVVAAFFDKYPCQQGLRLSLMLRMNSVRYAADLVALLLPVLQASAGQLRPLEELQAEVTQSATLLSTVLAQWSQQRAQFPTDWQQQPAGRAALFAETRLQALHKSLAAAGFHPQQHEQLLAAVHDDAQGMTELALLLHEALWQLESLVHTCLRRWPQVLQRQDPVAAVLATWFDICRASLQGQAPMPAAVGDTTASTPQTTG